MNRDNIIKAILSLNELYEAYEAHNPDPVKQEAFRELVLITLAASAGQEGADLQTRILLDLIGISALKIAKLIGVESDDLMIAISMLEKKAWPERARKV